jgi:predicted ATPase
MGTFLRGWALAQQEQVEEGLAQMHEGLMAYRDTGAEVPGRCFLVLVLEAYGKNGRAEAGLRVLAELLPTMANNEERFFEAELHRLKGELLLSLYQDNHAEAETCVHQALDIARQQQAKSLELRAAMSLSRLWQQQGKRTEAYELLAPVYGWFTEGFDTADLQEAKALLEELAG